MSINVSVTNNIVINGQQLSDEPQEHYTLLGVLIWWGKLFVWAVQGLMLPPSPTSQPTHQSTTLPANQPTSQSTHHPITKWKEEESEDDAKYYYE